MIQLPPSLSPIITALIDRSYRPVVVGGYVRDAFLGLESKDIDIEVFGVEKLETLERLLSVFGKVSSVGKSYGVVKLQLEELEVDFSIPRKEKKVAQGHKGFEITLDGAISFSEAARRRDFTINAMGYDLKAQKLLDPFGGERDLKNRRLTMVDKKSFVEDPLRLYRAVQFVARFGLEVSESLTTLARQMVADRMLEELPKERVFEEMKKLLLKSKKPSIGFTLMQRWGMLEQFEELNALQGVPQDPVYHAEGDVWIHTLMVVDVMTRLHSGDQKRDLYLSLAALCHDLGKVNTTKMADGRIRAVGHEISGLALTESFIARLSDEHALLAKILPLVKHHLKPIQFYKQGAKSAAIRRLATEVNIRDLVLLAEADFFGRVSSDIVNGEFKAGRWLLERAEALKVSEKGPKPLLQGRDLVKAGLKPSKHFKKILEDSYELQLEGKISNHEEALQWLHKFLEHGL